MEVIGVYYENLVYYFYDLGYWVSIVLLNKIKVYSCSFNEKFKNDEIDVDLIVCLGVEWDLRIW